MNWKAQRQMDEDIEENKEMYKVKADVEVEE